MSGLAEWVSPQQVKLATSTLDGNAEASRLWKSIAVMGPSRLTRNSRAATRDRNRELKVGVLQVEFHQSDS